MANETINAKMTALANEVRTLSGATGKMGIDAMTTNVGEVNTEVDTQTDLIAQIAAVVDGLPEVGGPDIGEDSAVTTCAVTLQQRSLPITNYYATIYTINAGLSLGTGSHISTDTIISDVVCGSILVVDSHIPLLPGYNVTGGAALIKQDRNIWIFSIPQQLTDDIVITIREDD